ncbi:hypothetical protein C1645_787042 [Glomus cerebriforme]|uniref:Uncharacterized protein n=1 Tax=Glomus cerebriforme TaxID=658196 RepID=A0A397SAW8_9GLOM|nr:hypothetical protein C1645_787042 [Glomus cerebriforme]
MLYGITIFSFCLSSMHHSYIFHASPLVESGQLMKRCETDSDCAGSKCENGTCNSVSIECCWMPPIYCCGPGR